MSAAGSRSITGRSNSSTSLLPRYNHMKVDDHDDNADDDDVDEDDLMIIIMVI